MEKSIYAISGFIPSDEDVVSISIYKLIKYGKDEIRYAWVMINGSEGNGIGTQTNDFGEKEKEDALIQITRYKDEYFHLLKGSFEEAITFYQESKVFLQSKLDDVLRLRSETIA
jgi:hypothetical protein